jgi:hypothetical protein
MLLISNTISGSSNLDICFYHCLIFTFILHLKVLFNSPPPPLPSSSLLLLLLLLLLFIIYIVHLPVVRPRSCRVIYYFDTLALGIRHQLFDRVNSSREKRVFFFFSCLHSKSRKKSKPNTPLPIHQQPQSNSWFLQRKPRQ